MPEGGVSEGSGGGLGKGGGASEESLGALGRGGAIYHRGVCSVRGFAHSIRSRLNKQYFAHTVVSKLITDRDFLWGELISKYTLQEELISITETDLWEFQQKISHCRCRFSLGFQLFPLPIQISGSKHINSVMISATTVC